MLKLVKTRGKSIKYFNQIYDHFSKFPYQMLDGLHSMGRGWGAIRNYLNFVKDFLWRMETTQVSHFVSRSRIFYSVFCFPKSRATLLFSDFCFDQLHRSVTQLTRWACGPACSLGRASSWAALSSWASTGELSLELRHQTSLRWRPLAQIFVDF